MNKAAAANILALRDVGCQVIVDEGIGRPILLGTSRKSTLGKLLEMARQLKARVQGDEGELYKTTDDWRAMDS